MSYVVNWFWSGFSDVRSGIAQLIGLVPLVLSFFVFRQGDRKNIIYLKTCSDFLWAIHFFVLGELSGGMVNLVNTVRNVIFARRSKGMADRKYIPVLFCAFTMVCALPGLKGVYGLFAMVGSCFAIFGFWQTSVKKLRVCNLIGVTLWLVYGVWTVSVPTIISNVLSIVSIGSVLVGERKEGEVNC